MITFFLFVLGVIVGSFLNVVGLRFNSGLSLQGRSFCFFCRRTLKWYELLPVVSFLTQKGRCRGCKSKISWKYPLVEVWTGLIFVTVLTTHNSQLTTSLLHIVSGLLLVVIFGLFVVITIYDLRHKIIPDRLVYPVIILSGAFGILIGRTSFWDWMAGPILFAFFALIWALSRGRAMGFGDAKLALAIGLLLGLPQGLSALGLSFWIGMLATLAFVALLRSYPLFGLYKRLTMKSEIPFAPYLVLGAWLSFIFQLDLFHVAQFIQ